MIKQRFVTPLALMYSLIIVKMNSCTCKWHRWRGVSENEEKLHYMGEIMDAIATGWRGFPLSLCLCLIEHWFVSINSQSEWFPSWTDFAAYSTCSVSPKGSDTGWLSVNGVRHSATRRATDAHWHWPTGVTVSKRYVNDAALNNTEIYFIYLFYSEALYFIGFYISLNLLGRLMVRTITVPANYQ